jgi:hypothetical protein
MTNTTTIPPEAAEAAAKNHYEVWRDYNGTRSQTLPWEDIGPVEQEIHRETARAACLAMLAKWSGMYRTDNPSFLPAIILPLNTEPSDDK